MIKQLSHGNTDKVEVAFPSYGCQYYNETTTPSYQIKLPQKPLNQSNLINLKNNFF